MSYNIKRTYFLKNMFYNIQNMFNIIVIICNFALHSETEVYEWCRY